MTMEAGSEVASGAGRDVARELGFLQQRIGGFARGRAGEDLKDIAADAWIRLDRALRREPALDLEALMTRIAWRAWVDYCRRSAARTRAMGRPVDVEDLQLEVPEQERGVDPHALALWRFAVCEWFEKNRPHCLDPARCFLDGRPWTELAGRLGERPNSLAKRWQRCREAFIAAARTDNGQLRLLLERFEGEFA